MSKQFVRCCEDTANEDNIYFDDDDNDFKMSGIYDAPIYYCPWCGVLLDLNLEMTGETPLEGKA